MSAPTRLSSWREIILGLFPWMARVGLSASKALQVRSAVGRTELEGGGPSVLRVGDVRGIVFDAGVPSSLKPALYYTADGGTTFVLIAEVAPGSTVGGTVAPPTRVTPFTAMAPTGSSKVTCG